MKVTLLTVFSLAAVLLNSTPANAVNCIRRDGELVLQDNGEDIPPGPFDCMRIRAKTKTTSETKLKDSGPDGDFCSFRVKNKAKSETRYTRSEMKAGTYCKYKCIEGTGYKCSYKMHKNGVCRCEPAGPRTVTVAVVGGKGPDALGETCGDKWEGYEFADAVACTRIRMERRKERLVETGDGMCLKKVESIEETRFMRTEKVDKNLQGCVYVCKKGLIKCLGQDDGKRCRCGRIGLRKVLIGMNEKEVAGRVDQTKCKGNDCGPCGVCVKGTCLLKKYASKGNNCPCGEICPEADRRLGGKGGKIFCEPNWRLGCRTVAKWMRVGQPGTYKPDLCTSGQVDAADTCSCAEGYIEVYEKYGETKCRKAPKEIVE